MKWDIAEIRKLIVSQKKIIIKNQKISENVKKKDEFMCVFEKRGEKWEKRLRSRAILARKKAENNENEKEKEKKIASVA